MDDSQHEINHELLRHFLRELPDNSIIVRPSDVPITHQVRQNDSEPTAPSTIPPISSTAETIGPELDITIPVDLSAVALRASEVTDMQSMGQEVPDQSGNVDNHNTPEDRERFDNNSSHSHAKADTEGEPPLDNTPPNPPPPETPPGREIPSDDGEPNDSEKNLSQRSNQLELEKTYKETMTVIETQLEHTREAAIAATSPKQLKELDVDGVVHELAAAVFNGVEELAPQAVSLAENFGSSGLLTKAYLAATVAGDLQTSIVASKKLHGLLFTEKVGVQESGAERAAQWVTPQGPLHTLVATCAENNISAEPWIELYGVDGGDRANLTIHYHTARHLLHNKDGNVLGIQSLEEAIEISLEQISPTTRDLFQRISVLPIIRNTDLRKRVLEDFVVQADTAFIDNSLAHRTINTSIQLLRDPAISSDMVELLDRVVHACELEPDSLPMGRWQLAQEAYHNSDAHHLIAYINRSKYEAIEALFGSSLLAKNDSELTVKERSAIAQMTYRADSLLTTLVANSVQANNLTRAATFLPYIQDEHLRLKAVLQCLEITDSHLQLALLRSGPSTDSARFTFLLNLGASIVDRNSSEIIGSMHDIVTELTSGGAQALPRERLLEIGTYIIRNLQRIDSALASRAIELLEDAEYQTTPSRYFSNKYELDPNSHARALVRLKRIQKSSLPSEEKLISTLELATKLSAVRQSPRSQK